MTTGLTALPAQMVFPFMAPSHVAALAIVASACVVVPLAVRRLGRPGLTRAVAWTLAAALLLNEAMYYVYMLGQVEVMHFLRNSLPLHVCGIAVFLTAWVLVRHHQFLYEIAYYWGLGGTLQAVLTPSLEVDYPHYLYFQFFFTHGGIVLGVLLATVALGRRPRPGSVLRVFLASNVLMVPVAGANALLGANYMFLCRPPLGASPFFFLPWPWFLIFLEAFGLGVLYLLYLPFCLRRRAAWPAPRP